MNIEPHDCTTRVHLLTGAAEAAIRTLQATVNAARVGWPDGGSPVELLEALLAIPDERPGAFEAEHVVALDDVLGAIRDAMVDGGVQ